MPSERLRVWSDSNLPRRDSLAGLESHLSRRVRSIAVVVDSQWRPDLSPRWGRSYGRTWIWPASTALHGRTIAPVVSWSPLPETLKSSQLFGGS